MRDNEKEGGRMRATAGELRKRNTRVVEKIKTIRRKEKEQARWKKFKAGLRRETDLSEKEKIILDMSKSGASVKEIKEVVSCGRGIIGQVRLSARRRGEW